MKKCDGCDIGFDPVLEKCVHCRYNTMERTEDNFVEKNIELFVPKFSINSLKLKASGDWNWGLTQVLDDPDNEFFLKHKDNRYNYLYDLFIYSNGIEIKERTMVYNICWHKEAVKVISDYYNLPMNHYKEQKIKE